jgi:hypothetical protein
MESEREGKLTENMMRLMVSRGDSTAREASCKAAQSSCLCTSSMEALCFRAFSSGISFKTSDFEQLEDIVRPLNNEIGSRNVDQVSTLVNALIVLRFNTNITAAERSLYTWESEGKEQRNWQRIRIAYNFERFICSQPNQLTSIVQPYQIQ